MTKGQYSVSDAVLKKPDLLEREETVLRDITKRSGFEAEKRLGDSRYWTRDFAGAVFYLGKYQGKAAVLKIQGTKPPIAEIDQIENFAAQNQSQVIRPPKLYGYLKWDETNKYEALFLEEVEGKPIVSCPTNGEELKEFFELYQEYRQNCLIKPWLPKPELTLPEIIEADFNNWRLIAKKLYPVHPLRKANDAGLIGVVVAKLKNEYQAYEPQFIHGHFSYLDLLKTKSGEVILFSNLFWKYKAPWYDSVFGQHWFRYRLSSIKEIAPKEVEAQRELWLKEIWALAQNEEDKKLINLALLERAAAGLNLDALSVDPKIPITEYLVEATRQEVKRLL
ncbi:hypothetical protein A2W24_01635 [Microgenomates group bacterium RBG_16_45_19]|nr:MAG: hypothetical protein A2W24_01635 [Microgenomates group bacterium RBG_16_45_19]